MSSFFENLKTFFGFNEEEVMAASTNKSAAEQNASRSQRPAAPQSGNGYPQRMSPQPQIKGFRGALVQTNTQLPLTEIKIEEPRVYEDSLTIALHLREGKPVIVNLKFLDNPSGKRLIDFVCGTAYAISGHMLKIGENIFLFTPQNIEIVNSQEEKARMEQVQQQNQFGLEHEEREIFFKKANY